MPTVLPSMGLTLPTRGAGGAGAWGDTIDADLALVDAHDHTTGRGARIPSAGIGINADLPFSALWAPTQLHRVQFSAIAGSALPAGQRKSLFVSDGTGGLSANDLYYLTNAGATVKITNGSALNVGAFVGGIGGDYTSVGAQLNWTDSSKTYDFKEGTLDSLGWGRLQCGGIRLIEFNTTETLWVAQIAPAALALSYTVTWPTGAPAANNNPVFMDATGVLTVPDAPTFAGLVTLAAGATASANQHITVSGTGDIKHGDRTLIFQGCAGVSQNIANIIYLGGGAIASNTGAATFYFAVPLRTGDRVKSLTFARFGNAAANITAVNLVRVSASAAGTSTNIATGSVATPAAAWNDTTITVGSPAALVAGDAVYIEVICDAASIRVNNLRVVYDRP